MSSRLAFQTQLASIMEVLANAAVAEICKLVDDDYAVVSLQMSQCQRENKALKRKLHLLELKMARGNAERRLRESAVNSSRPRVQINTGDRLRESSPCTDAVFERQLDAALWSGRAAAAGDTAGKLIQSDSIQRQSPDVELVEPVLVKEEKMEANALPVEETEEDIHLIGDDGVVECVPCGSAAQRPSGEQQDTQSTSGQSQTQSSRTRPSVSRRVEKEEEEDPDLVLVKVEDVEPGTGSRSQSGLSIQEGLVESSTDDFRAALQFDETTQTSTNQLSDLQESGQGFSESAAPPVTSQDPGGVVAVQLRVPDTSTQQQQRAQSSEYSLFDLEAFFTRWAPEGDPASARAGPSCSFAAGDLAESDQDGVVVVETEPLPAPCSAPSAVRMGGGQSLSSAVHIQGMSRSTPSRIQAPWSRASAMVRSAKAQLLQQHRDGNRVSQQQLSSPSTQTTADGGDKTAVSGISSTMAQQSALPVRGPTAAFSGIDTAVAAQHRARLLTCHSKNQAANVLPGERRRRSYVCRVCGKAFSGLSNLEAHERVHTGEKPFRCDTCGKRFSEAGNLKKHQRVHTGEKPFSCDQCGKRFAWICNLRTHQQSATGCGPPVRGGISLG